MAEGSEGAEPKFTGQASLESSPSFLLGFSANAIPYQRHPDQFKFQHGLLDHAFGRNKLFYDTVLRTVVKRSLLEGI